MKPASVSFGHFIEDGMRRGRRAVYRPGVVRSVPLPPLHLRTDALKSAQERITWQACHATKTETHRGRDRQRAAAFTRQTRRERA